MMVSSRWSLVVLALLIALALGAAARLTPHPIRQQAAAQEYAVLDGGQLLRFAAPDWRPSGEPVAAPGVSGLIRAADDHYYACRGREIVRLDRDQWVPLATFDGALVQLLPAPDGSAELVALTGRTGQPVLADGRVWRVPLAGAAPTRVESVRDGYRPWRLEASRVGDEARLAVSTYRATRFWPVEHKCQFLYAWSSQTVQPVWLGSRLSRPYRQAVHADLRGDGRWRMVAIEDEADGSAGLGVYTPIGFGYEGEWRGPPLPGARDLDLVGDRVIVLGDDQAWQLRAVGADAYGLVALRPAPPTLDSLAVIGGQLIGYWDGAVHELRPEDSDGEGPR